MAIRDFRGRHLVRSEPIFARNPRSRKVPVLVPVVTHQVVLTGDLHKNAGVFPALDWTLTDRVCGFYEPNLWFYVEHKLSLQEPQINVSFPTPMTTITLRFYLYSAGIPTQIAHAVLTATDLAGQQTLAPVAWTWDVDSGTGSAGLLLDFETIPLS